MKRGEADNTQKQPRVGSVQVDAQGRRWVKAHQLSSGQWRESLASAHFSLRFGGVTEGDLRSMGYELEAAP